MIHKIKYYLFAVLIVGLGSAVFLIYKSKNGHEAIAVELVETYLKENPNYLNGLESLHITKRDGGKNVGEGFVRSQNWRSAIEQATSMAPNDKEPTHLILCFGANYKKVKTPVSGKRFARAHMGVFGVEYRFHGKESNVCGSQSIAMNRTPWKQLKRFAKKLYLPIEHVNAPDLEAKLYESKVFWIDLKKKKLIPLYRGNQIVSHSDVNQKQIKKLSNRMARWLFKNTKKSGEMRYKYWPSTGKYSKANNMIRQFMATLAIRRWAERSNKAKHHDIARKNLKYNLEAYYGSQKGLGYIEFNEKRKLGSAALAALSILESPVRDIHKNEYKGLTKAIEHQWQPSGELRTFILQDRNDQQNFYPGEALYFWAHMLEKNKDKKILQKFMKSVKYHYAWHLKNRNPAFIPWHTQAYYKIWQQNKSNFLKKIIFEMNDWLITNMQDEEEDKGYKFQDIKGRFYNSSGQYGPPHASSTGVYLEGLIDAFALAKQVGDTARQERYRRSIVKGLRHVMQLEFRNNIDMYYITKKKRVRGGLRTTVYNNTIRVDNNQHNLLALMKIMDRFSEADYKL